MIDQSQITSLRAWISRDDTRQEVSIRYASKYSLWVRFSDDMIHKGGETYTELEIETDDEVFELGPCTLLSEPNIDGYAGRLVLTSDFHDFESLFFHQKVAKLQTAFLNLKLLLDHKKKIKKPFKDFVADLSYDLSIYKNLFDTLDAEYENEPPNVKKLIQESVLTTEGAMLTAYMDENLATLMDLVKDFNKSDRERHGFYFRRQLWDVILSSPIMARTNLKPRGYAGDSEMMRMIYEYGYEGSSTFSRIMHHYPISQPAAQCVRNRRAYIAEWIRDLPSTQSEAEGKGFRILSIACGPAAEITDILKTPEDIDTYRFTLFDQDRYALMEAAKRVNLIEKKFDSKISIEYLRESVRTMICSSELIQKWGRFNAIYSLGLFDYLTPPVAQAVLTKLYQLLLPGGEMVIGNLHSDNPSRFFMEYWLDWVIYYRNEEEFRSLADRLPGAETRLATDETGVQLFLHIKKNGT